VATGRLRQRLLQQSDVLGEHHAPLLAVVHAAPHQQGFARAQARRGGLERLGEHRDVDGAVHVLEREEGHPVPALGRRLLEPVGMTEEDDAGAVALGGQVAGGRDPSVSTTPRKRASGWPEM